MHLIQPIDIDSTLYCVDEQDNNRTEAILAGAAAFQSEDANASYWTVAYTADDGVSDGAGSITFGTSCAPEVTILLTTDGDIPLTNWEVTLNGVTVDSGVTQTGVDAAVGVTMTPSPCGNIIVISGYFTDNSHGECTLACAILF